MDMQKNILLIVGIILIIVSVGLLAYANNELSNCESLGGKFAQFFDKSSREGCAAFKTLQVVSYVGIAIGAGLVVVNFVKKR